MKKNNCKETHYSSCSTVYKFYRFSNRTKVTIQKTSTATNQHFARV